MAFPDRGYTNLLAHLQRSPTSLPLQTIQVSCSHYLAHVQPSPTPLSASIISSPLFRTFSHPKLVALTTTYRHAVHHKLKVLEDEGTSIFDRSKKARLSDWIGDVLKGLEGGAAMLRLVCSGGLLLGLEDVKSTVDVRIRGKVEDEVVVELAEVLDAYSYGSVSDGWEKEFQPGIGSEPVDPASLALVVSSQFLLLVASEKLNALPLPTLIGLLTSTIASCFQSGSFLADLKVSTIQDTGKLSIPRTSDLSQTIQALTSSSYFTSIAPLSKLGSRCISLVATSRPRQSWTVMQQTLKTLDSVSEKVEQAWVGSALAGVSGDDDILPESREVSTHIWVLHKTLLFSTLMLSQSALTSLVFVRKPPSPPSFMALSILKTLSHLSFVISQFGGITASGEGSFRELKKTVYMALDVISVDRDGSERFVKELCSQFERAHITVNAAGFERPYQAKKSFALACIEQLIPVISEDCMENQVLPLCLPHLSDPSNRETYESAHSVVLAMFSANTQAKKGTTGEAPGRGKDKEVLKSLAERIAPFYAKNLIENSRVGRLTTDQLRLASATLALSASTSSAESVCFYLSKLLDAIGSAAVQEQRHRLLLALTSTLSALPLTILPRILDELRDAIIKAYPDDNSEEREELAEALFTEILERVGDREKEFAKEWWYANRLMLSGGRHGTDDKDAGSKGTSARL
ncbi:hypothetical protein JAAARDRAFT_189618 [Jaapia argillacea MUCL 33604]|uniref:Uncharacterized protein n=1 Tax=Jaapia argillacea MUCL 33604 TaxID=933084 RepID=A0A067QI45_9AGAM|nr:hypothetical protein JAAARDRAFT_189618 [Jaapia argillacea MUCL 33604]